MLIINLVFNLRKAAVIYLFTIFTLFYSMNGAAMSPLFGTDVVLFPPLQGKLTYQSEPAVNAKIVRHLIWKDDTGEKETFYANEKDEFTLPIKREKVKIPLLGEFVIAQQISVIFENREFIIWYKGSSATDEFSGLGGYLSNLKCELTDEPVRINNFDALFTTSCKWDSIIKQGE